jgi:DUF4097 and DUF4098 domain-containing protein YvlB
VVVESSLETDGILRIGVSERRRRSAAWKRRKGLTIELATPPQTTLIIDGAAIDVNSEGRLESVRFTSAAGHARLDEVAGDVDVKGAAGDITVGRVAGHLNVQLASGDISASSVSRGCNLRTASGDLSLGSRAGQGSISSLSGDVEIGSADPGSLSVHVVSGEVVVGIAPGVSTALDVSTLSGTTRSDLEVSSAPLTADGPQLELKVNTVSGDILIRSATRDTAA